jgi:hypothetical protein
LACFVKVVQMSTEKILTPALSKKEFLLEVADRFSSIADSLHFSLRGLTNEKDVSPQKAYALITEEYGLRTRISILKGDSENRIVSGVQEDQASLLDLLVETEGLIKKMNSVDDLAFLVNSVSVLCIAIFPSKNLTLDFLIDCLRSDVGRFSKKY